MKKSAVLTLLVVLFACELKTSSATGGSNTGTPLIGKVKPYWVIDYEKEAGDAGYNYQVHFRNVYENSAAIVLIDSSKTNVSLSSITSLADSFRDNVIPKTDDIYGAPTDVDGNGKILIMLYDIKDGGTAQTGFVGGYFFSVNLFDQTEIPSIYRSNEAEMVFIDCNEVSITSAYTKSVLAHEYQHLVGYVDRRLRQNKGTMQTWINEGLAEHASYDVYGQSAIQGRFHFLSDNSGFDPTTSLIHWNSSLTDYSYSATFINFIVNKVAVEKTFLTSLNQSTGGDHLALGSLLSGIYTGTDVERFNKAFYDYSVHGLFEVQTGIFPSVTKGSSNTTGKFSGIGFRSSSSYNQQGYVPVFLKYDTASSISVTNAALMDISTSTLSIANSVSNLAAYNGNSYGVVFMTGLFATESTKTMTLSQSPINSKSKKARTANSPFILDRKVTFDQTKY
jgi:hypothetical protein